MTRCTQHPPNMSREEAAEANKLSDMSGNDLYDNTAVFNYETAQVDVVLAEAGASCAPRAADSSHYDGMAGGERRGALHGWTGTENAPTQRDRVPRQMGRASGDRGWQMHHPHKTA